MWVWEKLAIYKNFVIFSQDETSVQLFQQVLQNMSFQEVEVALYVDQTSQVTID